MIAVKKKILTINFENENIVDNIVKNTNNIRLYAYVLVASNNDNLIFCLPEELDDALKKLPKKLIDEFARNYSINEDIYDCRDAFDLINDISLSVCTILNLNIEGYFSPLNEYCELYLIDEYNSQKKMNFQSSSENLSRVNKKVLA